MGETYNPSFANSQIKCKAIIETVQWTDITFQVTISHSNLICILQFSSILSSTQYGRGHPAWCTIEERFSVWVFSGGEESKWNYSVFPEEKRWQILILCILKRVIIRCVCRKCPGETNLKISSKLPLPQRKKKHCGNIVKCTPCTNIHSASAKS